jgi:hypothetical protein
VCPDYCFEVFKFDRPLESADTSSQTSPQVPA